ncbi:type II toxin-antitoxin system VapC family toxin [Spirochaeta lutea]|uniref:type II toxin-antitoxin system VapC family toxin n=1 Tax=Spirochaeta lutea TaxID=1480694 RepID=UPI000B31408E|nr:PIN domain-containing protein [Spirochaeta lutea]
MIKTYIDCNIIIDWVMDREPFSYYSARIIELVENQKIIGIVSPLTLANSYYILNKTLNKKIADEFISDCLQLFKVVPVNVHHLQQAIQNKYKDFEDDIHAAVAIENNVDFLITRNTKDFHSTNFKVIDAEGFINEFKNTR